MQHSSIGDINGFAEYLRDKSALSPTGLSRLLAASETTGQSVDTVLTELGLVREDELTRHLANYSGTETCKPSFGELDGDLIQTIGINFLIRSSILPFNDGTGGSSLAVADPLTSDGIEMISYLLERKFNVLCAQRSQIQLLLNQWKEESNSANSQPIPDVEHSGELEQQDISRLKDVANEAPVIRLVSDIIQRAVENNATDIHIEPSADELMIRFRRDGVLETERRIPRHMQAGLATRIKILAQLNIAERRLPQDGRLRISVKGQEIDLRVSILPTVQGETFVLRILDRSTIPLQLDALGYSKPDVECIRRLSNLNDGIVLVTGPTGSGKTTTLYSMINEIDIGSRKVFTVEDPVEYRISGITQVQVNPEIGLDFSKTLRTVLRQDPDVILVGEIRDPETARIAIRAALTGHLVLSTLHTNSASAAFTRLMDMGIESYLLADTVRAVLGQRLVRRLCDKCLDRDIPGCGDCGGSRYRGRLASYEILDVTPALRGLINGGAGEADILRAARAGGFVEMAEHVQDLISRGLTNSAEAKRVFSGRGV